MKKKLRIGILLCILVLFFFMFYIKNLKEKIVNDINKEYIL